MIKNDSILHDKIKCISETPTKYIYRPENLPLKVELLKLKEKYVLVALENTVPTAQPLYNYEWDKNSLIVAGEEGIGITPETLKICDKFVYIPQYGSVRSMNAAAAVSIALYDYTAKFKK